MEAAESKSQEINSNEEVIVFSDSDEDQTDLKVKEFLAGCSFSPTFSKTDKDKRPESPGEMIVSGNDEPEDEDGESDKSMSELSQGLNTSSADTVLVSQNSQPPLEVEEMEEEDMVEGGDTQIIDQSDPPSSDCQSDKSLARDQNSNDAEKKKSIPEEFKNSGAYYWMNEMLKSLRNPKKLDIEDPSFPFTSSSSKKMNTNTPS